LELAFIRLADQRLLRSCSLVIIFALQLGTVTFMLLYLQKSGKERKIDLSKFKYRISILKDARIVLTRFNLILTIKSN
jgi:hypothetical protein